MVALQDFFWPRQCATYLSRYRNSPCINCVFGIIVSYIVISEDNSKIYRSGIGVDCLYAFSAKGIAFARMPLWRVMRTKLASPRRALSLRSRGAPCISSPSLSKEGLGWIVGVLSANGLLMRTHRTRLAAAQASLLRYAFLCAPAGSAST